MYENLILRLEDVVFKKDNKKGYYLDVDRSGTSLVISVYHKTAPRYNQLLLDKKAITKLRDTLNTFLEEV